MFESRAAPEMPRGWRDVLTPHPACELFRRATPDTELDALAEDIRTNGLHYPATLAIVGGILQLIDGSRRLDALEKLGFELLDRNGDFHKASQLGLPRPFADRPDIVVENLGVIDDPVGIVVSLNVVRRHSSLKERREHARDLIKLKPELSNRAIADLVQIDHATVGAQRRTLERTGEIHQLAKHVGRDGKMRRSHPATEPANQITISTTGPATQPDGEFPGSTDEQVQSQPSQSSGDTAPPSRVLAEVTSIAGFINALRLLDHLRGETAIDFAERLAVALDPNGDREIARIGDQEIIRLLENSCLALKEVWRAFEHRKNRHTATRPAAEFKPRCRDLKCRAPFCLTRMTMRRTNMRPTSSLVRHPRRSRQKTFDTEVAHD